MVRRRKDSFEDFAERFGARVAQLRERQGVSQEKLAEQAGIEASYVVKIEGARRQPSLQVIHKLANALRCEPMELFNFADQPDVWTGREPEAEWLKFRDELEGATARDVRLLRELAAKVWSR